MDRRSGMDQLDMAARSCRQRLKIGTINGDDVVAVAREQDNGSVNDVGYASSAEQSPCSSTERLIKCDDLDAPERLGQTSLTRAAAPHLPKNSGMGDRNFTAYLRSLQPDPHLTFVAFQRHECSAVEHKGHADLVVRVVGRRWPRTTRAFSRSARR